MKGCDLLVKGTALFSDCGLYRYTLTRRWADEGWFCTVTGLNSSTATADEDDPTIRRCIGFARREGAAGLRMLNLYGYRSTDPAGLREVNDPFGPGNRAAWQEAFVESVATGTAIVCAWGVHGPLYGGDKEFIGRALSAGAHLACLGKTKDGHPKHPLYLKASTPFEEFP